MFLKVRLLALSKFANQRKTVYFQNMVIFCSAIFIDLAFLLKFNMSCIGKFMFTCQHTCMMSSRLELTPELASPSVSRLCRKAKTCSSYTPLKCSKTAPRQAGTKRSRRTAQRACSRTLSLRPWATSMPLMKDLISWESSWALEMNEQS